MAPNKQVSLTAFEISPMTVVVGKSINFAPLTQSTVEIQLPTVAEQDNYWAWKEDDLQEHDLYWVWPSNPARGGVDTNHICKRSLELYTKRDSVDSDSYWDQRSVKDKEASSDSCSTPQKVNGQFVSYWAW